MGFHHIALATRDTAATHHFYTAVMGFDLVKVVVSPTPGDHGGWSKHFFYSTAPSGTPSSDNGMIAFWELHDDHIGNDFNIDFNTPNGLPGWVNHFAFDSPTIDHLNAMRERWLSHGVAAVQIEHDFCVSIYATDPNGHTVEFCHTTRPFTPEEIESAQQVVHDPHPPFQSHEAVVTFHHPPVAANA